jgi:RNA polymerase sigma-70 factor (ECF subfamily)
MNEADPPWDAAVLYRATAPSLFVRARLLARGDRQQAEDLVQEVFVAALHSWGKVGALRPEAQQRWLFAVLTNKAVDTWRRIGRIDVMDATGGHDRPGSADETYTRAACSMAWRRAFEIIQQMPPARHHVVCLRWIAGWSAAEISIELGIRQATVRVHLKNARDTLITEIGPDVPFLNELPVDEPSQEGVQA